MCFLHIKTPCFSKYTLFSHGCLNSAKGSPSSDGNLMLLYYSYFVGYRQKLSPVQSMPHTQYQVNGSQCLQHVLDMTQDIYLI